MHGKHKIHARPTFRIQVLFVVPALVEPLPSVRRLSSEPLLSLFPQLAAFRSVVLVRLVASFLAPACKYHVLIEFGECPNPKQVTLSIKDRRFRSNDILTILTFLVLFVLSHLSLFSLIFLALFFAVPCDRTYSITTAQSLPY